MLRVGKDAADNLRFIIGGDDSEAYQASNLGNWQAGEWHYVAVTWTIPGAMTTYVDGVQVISHPSRAQDLITSMPAELFVSRQAESHHRHNRRGTGKRGNQGQGAAAAPEGGARSISIS